MNSENDEDMEQARKWLLVDQKDLANFAAEHAKRYRQRKAAMAYADPAAQLPQPEAVSFAPLPCVECGVALTNQNHDNHFRCRNCVQREVGMTWTRAHRAIRHERKLKAQALAQAQPHA